MNANIWVCILIPNLTSNPISNTLKSKLPNLLVFSANYVFFFSPKSTLLLCHAFIHPHLIFALPVWGSTFPTYLSKLQRLQNMAIRINANCNCFQSLTPYFHELKILKISELFQSEIGKIMYKHSNKQLPTRFNFLSTLLSSIYIRHFLIKHHYRCSSRINSWFPFLSNLH